MDVTSKIHAKLSKILKKLKGLGVIQTFILEMNFCEKEASVTKSLIEIDAVLKKCLRKIMSKPRKAEIRNVITELVRKKNLNDFFIIDKPNKNNLLVTKLRGNDNNDAFPLNFLCDLCGEIFNSEKNLLIHKKKHNKNEIYLCEKCGELFYSIKKWLEHQTDIREQSEVPTKMKNLSENFKSKMMKSQNRALNGSPASPESQVKAGFISQYVKKSLLEEELKNSVQKYNTGSHGSKKPGTEFICICGKVFKLLKSLRRHEKIKHSIRNIQYKCITCEKCFIEKGKLNRHMLSHSGCQYSCSFCSKQFSRSDTLKRHMSLFHFTPKKFFCSFCEKKFNLKYNRDIHEENIHKNLNNRVQCDYCKGQFSNKVTLKSHLKIHFESKITCKACGKSFSRKSNFKVHVKNQHFGITPFE